MPTTAAPGPAGRWRAGGDGSCLWLWLDPPWLCECSSPSDLCQGISEIPKSSWSTLLKAVRTSVPRDVFLSVFSLTLLAVLGGFQHQSCPVHPPEHLTIVPRWGHCSPSLCFKGSVGCSDVCKTHCSISRSVRPNSWRELLVELDMLVITLRPATSGPCNSCTSGLGLWD